LTHKGSRRGKAIDFLATPFRQQELCTHFGYTLVCSEIASD